MSECVTLDQLLDSLGNMNHAVSVVFNWIFLFKLQKIHSVEYLFIEFNFCCSGEEEYFSNFLEVYYAVMCVNPKPKYKCV